MAKVGKCSDTTKDLKVVEAEVQSATEKIMDAIDYEGDVDEK
jgi:hypothetical protein